MIPGTWDLWRIPSAVDPSDRSLSRLYPLLKGVTKCHRPYWILPTKEANGFLFASLNHFIFALEGIMLRKGSGTEGLTVASAKQQEIIGVMVSALVRTLQLSLNDSNPARDHKSG